MKTYVVRGADLELDNIFANWLVDVYISVPKKRLNAHNAFTDINRKDRTQ